jgi:hypothetical protein
VSEWGRKEGRKEGHVTWVHACNCCAAVIKRIMKRRMEIIIKEERERKREKERERERERRQKKRASSSVRR